MIVAIITHLFATAPDPDEAGPLGTADIEEQLHHLVDFTAAGFAASRSKE